MKRTIALCLGLPALGLGLLALAAPAAADSPVAVVEEVQGKVTGAEFMDYVTPKAVIKIGDGGSVILSYLKSCRRETISGAGTVIVGTQESAVHLAEVKAEKTNCDPNQANATTRETAGVAATVLRSVDAASLPQPQLTLYGASPLVEAKGRGKLVIRRLDVPGERQEINLGGRDASSISPAKTSPWFPAASTPPRSNHRRSCSGWTRRPSPA
jgi:hypothetical protein